MDGLGNPLTFLFSGGNAHDSTAAIGLLSMVDINGSIVNGDKAYGSEEVRNYILSQGAAYAIHPKQNAREPWDVDWAQYKERHLVECFFNKLKHFRRVDTRYDKLTSRFQSFVFLASM